MGKGKAGKESGRRERSSGGDNVELVVEDNQRQRALASADIYHALPFWATTNNSKHGAPANKPQAEHAIWYALEL